MSKQFLALFFVFMLFLFGCQQEEDERLANQGENNNQYVHVKNSDPANYEELSNQQITKHLANLANDVPNVNHAAAVVAGPYAVVGIDVDKDLDRSRVGTIKYAVTEALQHDPYGKTAVVVADADGAERIKEMANKVQQGHPIQGIVDELAAIVGRYMPEFPINEDQPENQDQNQQVIPEGEEQQLEEIQEEQSNHHKNDNN